MSTAEAAHEFGALNTLLLVVILGLCILAAYLIKQNSFYYLPESAAAIVVGAVVGGLAKLVYPSTEELHFLTFEPELFFFLLLPPIIFEAGYSLRKRDFFANFWSIMMYAVFGTIVSTFIIGYLVFWVGQSGLVAIDTTSPMEALVFGALISAVDPVATLSIMGKEELHVDKLLYSLVFGESVLNDAVSIVLFKTFMQFYEAGAEFSANTLAIILWSFMVMSIGSVVVGVVTGLLCSYVCKHTQLHQYPEYEISILFLFAYGSYSFSESIGLSGIMALFFCGIILSHYNSYNLSVTSQITAHNIFKSLAVLSEYLVFLYIGMGLFTSTYKHIHFGFTALAMLFCIIGRIGNIFPLSWIANCWRKKKIPISMQVVMWFSGLRGAIAFALSQNMPIEHRSVYVSTTLMIVIFTTIICGGLTEPMLSRMGMRGVGASPTPSVDEEEDSYDEEMEVSTGLEEEENLAKLRIGSGSQLSGSSYEPMRTTDSEEETVGLSPLHRADSLISQHSSHNSPVGHTHHHHRSGRGNNRQNNRNSGSSSSSSGKPLTFRKRSQQFLRKFERDYMTPLFGGPSKREMEQFEDDVDIHGRSNLLQEIELNHNPTLRSRAPSIHK